MIYGPYRATADSVVDGDTLHVAIDLGFGLTEHLSCRIYGVNAPELSTQEGKDAKAFAQTLLPPGSAITLTSYGWDKYGGRFDGKVTLQDGRDFATVMVAEGHAVPLP